LHQHTNFKKKACLETGKIIISIADQVVIFIAAFKMEMATVFYNKCFKETELLVKKVYQGL
jgi:hypothetical protein